MPYINCFKVTTKPHQIGVWDPLVCGTRDLTGKVYEGIHTLPPSGFELSEHLSGPNG